MKLILAAALVALTASSAAAFSSADFAPVLTFPDSFVEGTTAGSTGQATLSSQGQ